MLIESTRDSLCFTVTHYKHSKQQYSIQVRGQWGSGAREQDAQGTSVWNSWLLRPPSCPRIPLRQGSLQALLRVKVRSQVNLRVPSMVLLFLPGWKHCPCWTASGL